MTVWKTVPEHPDYEMSDLGDVRHKETGRRVGRKASLYCDGRRITLDVDEVYQRLQPFDTECKDIDVFPSHEIDHDQLVYNKRTGECNGIVLVFRKGTSKTRVNYHLLFEKLFTNALRRPYLLTILSLQRKYPHLTFKKFYEQPPYARESLMCIKYPHLLADWADCDEVGDIYFGSDRVRRWNCSAGHDPY